jgi:hypothetical protein
MTKSKNIFIFSLVFIFSLISTYILSRLALFGNSELFNIGDYYFEVDPVLLNFLKEPNIEFYNSFFPPQMMPLSVIIRAPAIFLFESLGFVSNVTDPVFYTKEFRERYLAGAMTIVFLSLLVIFTVIFKSFPAFFKNGLTKKDVFITIGFAVLAALMFALNPLIVSSIVWGHPEETLMAALLAAGGLLLLKRDYLWAGIILGLAIATKQPAVFILPAAFFFVPSEYRKKFVGALVITSFIFIVPWMLTHPVDFFEQNFLIAGSQDFNVPRGFDILSPLGLRDWGEIGKPLMFLIAFLLPFSLARLNQDKKSLRLSKLKITPLQFAGAVPIIFIIRFAFDLGNISYYALPAGMSFIFLDYLIQRKKGGVWRESVPNPPMVLPTLTFFMSIFFAIVFYQELFREMGPDWRGGLTLIVIGFPLLAGILSLYQPVSSKIKLKEWIVTGITGLLIIFLLVGYHSISDQPNLARQYKDLKEYRSNEKMSRALPEEQTGYWLGENSAIKRELLFRGMDGGIVYNVYSPEGRRTTYFDYGIEGSKKSVEITTYNTVLADRKDFINQCLNKTGDCLGYKPVYNLAVGDAVILRNNQGFDGYVKTNNNQTVYIKSNDTDIDPQEVLNLLKPLD